MVQGFIQIPYQQVWYALPDRFPTLPWDAFVVMPNHIHAIIVLTDPTINNPQATDRYHPE